MMPTFKKNTNGSKYSSTSTNGLNSPKEDLLEKHD